MNKPHKIELLSPAGSMDALKQAIHNGADAIYLGGSHFGARAFAHNFDKHEMKKAVDYAHLYGVKIYVTVNTLIYEDEIQPFKEYINFLVKTGVDALIMQDLGMANWAINTFDIQVHSSTQMHNYSVSNIEYLKANGFQRAVAARETTVEDIAEMSKLLETEVFAHGALCISYSGQCLFSAMEHQRSGNRGRCAQACRMKYSLYADDELIAKDKFLLSPKDLALLEDVDKIIDSGAGSIKLEGRMKSPEYVGFVTKTYRKIIDNQSTVSNNDKNILKRLFNRGFTKGFAFGFDNKTMMSIDRPNHAGVYIGDVISTSKEYINIQLKSTLHQGDGIKFDTNDKGFVCNKIYYKGKLVNKGEADQTIQLDNKLNLWGNDKVLLTKDTTLLKSLGEYKEKKIPVCISAEFYLNKPCSITMRDNEGNTAICQGEIVQQSKNAPLNKENIIKSLSKLGDTPYSAKDVQIDMDNNIFLSKGNLNKLRRNASDKLSQIRMQRVEYIRKDYSIDYSAPLTSPNAVCCVVNDESQLYTVLKHKADRVYIRDYKLYKKYKNEHPNAHYFMENLSGNTEEYKNERLVIRDTGGIHYAINNQTTADYMLNIANSQSIAHLNKLGVSNVCLSVELTDENIKNTISDYRRQYGNYPNTEIMVYGRVQLMAMKHCILEGNIKCGDCKHSKVYLEDIKGNKFPVTVDGKCNNYIYSKGAIDKTQNIELYKSMGVNGTRLDFYDESPDEIAEILNRIYT